MRSQDPMRAGSRLVDACVAVLLAAMALFGAVELVKAIWVPLCIALAVIVLLALAGWALISKMRRW